jgi:hypothetical protein
MEGLIDSHDALGGQRDGALRNLNQWFETVKASMEELDDSDGDEADGMMSSMQDAMREFERAREGGEIASRLHGAVNRFRERFEHMRYRVVLHRAAPRWCVTGVLRRGVTACRKEGRTTRTDDRDMGSALEVMQHTQAMLEERIKVRPGAACVCAGVYLSACVRVAYDASALLSSASPERGEGSKGEHRWVRSRRGCRELFLQCRHLVVSSCQPTRSRRCVCRGARCHLARRLRAKLAAERMTAVAAAASRSKAEEKKAAREQQRLLERATAAEQELIESRKREADLQQDVKRLQDELARSKLVSGVAHATFTHAVARWCACRHSHCACLLLVGFARRRRRLCQLPLLPVPILRR